MADQPDENIDWPSTTFEGHRKRQHEAFRRLSFREKLTVLEGLAEVAAYFFASKPKAGGSEPDQTAGGDTGSQGP